MRGNTPRKGDVGDRGKRIASVKRQKQKEGRERRSASIERNRRQCGKKQEKDRKKEEDPPKVAD